MKTKLGEREEGYYWVRIKGLDEVLVGYFEPKYTEEPWQVIGSPYLCEDCQLNVGPLICTKKDIPVF